MARVLYVSQYFVSGDQPGGVRHWQHTRALARAGHDVTVVTSYVQHKERTIPEEYRGKRIVRSHEDGMEVIRTYATPGYGRDMKSRMSNYGTFALWSVLAELRIPRPDVVVASSPPLPAAAAAAAFARARGARFLLEVRDLWPDSIIPLGVVKDGKVITAARKMEHFAYRRADRIVALTEGIRDGIIAQGIPAGRISLITNGVDLDMAGGEHAPAHIEGVADDAFVAMYVGNHGTYSSLGTVLQAAKMLEDDPAIQVVLVGGGDQKPMLQEMARDLGLVNTTFVDSVPKREVPAYLERADLGLIPYQDMPLFAGALPNKTFDYMAAKRPLLAAAPVGELTGLIDRAHCGWNVAPEDPTAMAAAIRDIAAQRDEAGVRGAAGHEYALAEYDRQVLAARFVRLVDDLAASPRKRRKHGSH